MRSHIVKGMIIGLGIVLTIYGISQVTRSANLRIGNPNQIYSDSKCDFISRAPNAILTCYSQGRQVYQQWIVRNGGVLCTTTGKQIRLHNMHCVEESR